MKKLFLLFLAGSMMFLSSCSKDEATAVSNEAMSSDEVAEIVSMSLSEDAMGATSVIESSVEVSSTASKPSKVKSSDIVYSKDTTITKVSNPSALISYSMTTSYEYNFTLDSIGTPKSSVVSYSYSGNFDAPRLSSAHNGSGVLSIGNLGNSVCEVNGSYERASDVLTKGIRAKESNSNTKLVFQSVLVDKSIRRIQSGTATLTMSGSVPRKGDYSFSGTVIFEGNDLASLTIEGKKYTINLRNGAYEAQ